jgi:hypothetical protein
VGPPAGNAAGTATGAGPAHAAAGSRDDDIPGVKPPADLSAQLWLATFPQHLVPRNKEIMRPSEWAILLAHSYSRRLCRETGAASAEIVRISREPVTPSVLYGNVPPPEAFYELTASFGEVSR